MLATAHDPKQTFGFARVMPSSTMSDDLLTMPIVRTDGRSNAVLVVVLRWVLGFASLATAAILAAVMAEGGMRPGALLLGLPWPLFVWSLLSRKEATAELRIDADGIRFTEGATTRTWAWREIAGAHPVSAHMSRSTTIHNLQIRRIGELSPPELGHYDLEPWRFGFTEDQLVSIIRTGVERWGPASPQSPA